MKKTVSLLLAALLVLFVTACSNSTNETHNKETTETTQSTEKSQTASSVEELEEVVTKDVETVVTELKNDFEKLSGKASTYKDYVKHSEEIADYYELINNSVEKLCNRMQGYTVQYADLIFDNYVQNKERYEEFEAIEDFIYSDTMDTVEDTIYDDLFDDLENAFYSGVLDDSDEADSYSDWYDVRSDEYKQWYDTKSDVYEIWYDTKSDIYEFYYDMRSDLYSSNDSRIEKTFNRYREKVNKLEK